MNITKKQYALDLAIVAAVVIVLIGLLLAIWTTGKAPEAHAGGVVLSCFDSSGNKCSGNATSTPLFLTANATTTVLTMNTANADRIDLNMSATASSTASKILWAYYFSNNGIDWYSQSLNSTSGANVTFTGTTTNAWTPATTGTTSLNTTLTPTGERFIQVRAQPTGGNAAIYFQGMVHNVIVN